MSITPRPRRQVGGGQGQQLISFDNPHRIGTDADALSGFYFSRATVRPAAEISI
jgi:hypothetical protein